MRRSHQLKAAFDQPLSFDQVDAGTVQFAGWCFHPDGELADLTLTINGTPHATQFALPRPDVADAFPDLAPAARSGFRAAAPLKPGTYRVALKADVAGVGVSRLVVSELLIVGNHRSPFLTFVATKALHRLDSGRGVPAWREISSLFRGASSDHKRVALTAKTHRSDAAGFDVPPRVDVYDAWLAVNAWGPKQTADLRRRLDAAGSLPRISVVTPVFRPDLKYFTETSESVRRQVYDNWEWCLADDASEDASLTAVLARLASEDGRIRVVTRAENGHISRASNLAAKLATGEFLAFLDHDDLLSPDALGEVALHLAAHPDVDVLYSDDDKIDAEGRRFGPQFKPDWSPEALLSQMYFSHLLVVRRRLFERVGGFRAGLEGSQDHDLALRTTELAQRVAHLPLVLYHWRAVPGSTAMSGQVKPYSFDAGIRAVEDAFERRGVAVKAERPPWAVRAGSSLIRHRFPDDGPSVAILVVTRNQVELLRRCLASLARTSYRHYEIVIVDDHSDDADALAFLADCGARILRVPGVRSGFNFAALCNHAARQVTSEYVLFLNNDTEVRNAQWLSQMVGFAGLQGVGAVGARLLFPNGKVQHAGVLHGFGQGSLALAFRGLPGSDAGYLAAARVCRNYGAVTGACLLTPRALFLDAGGFDEGAFPVSFNDVDYCDRISAKGYRCVYAAEAELTHHEGASRGIGSQPAEIARFHERYGHHVEPYFNPNLSTANERFEVQPRRIVRGHTRRLNAVMFSHALDLTGAPLCQLELTLALRARGVIAPHVISPRDGPLRARYEKQGISVSIQPGFCGFRSVEDYEELMSGVMRDLRAANADVVYGNTLKTFYAVDAARRVGIPSLWNVRESEPWQSCYTDLPRELGQLALGCFGDPYRVIFVSNASRAVHDALNARHNFCVVHDGLDVKNWRERVSRWTRSGARSQLGVDASDVAILLVGTVCERKGQHDLVEALALVEPALWNNIRSYVVGDRPGAYSEELARLVAGLPATLQQRVHVVAETGGVEPYYQAADVFACTSRVESYPQVTLEAMACGLPIISTPVFGLSEQLAEGANAIFYPPGDVGALAAALDRLVSEPALRAAMGRESRLVLAGLKTFEEMVDDYAVFFQEAALG